jgi:DNA repair protein RadC
MTRQVAGLAAVSITVHDHVIPTPSKPDIEMTRQVVRRLHLSPPSACRTDWVATVHDHVIVGKNRHTSFKLARSRPSPGHLI